MSHFLRSSHADNDDGVYHPHQYRNMSSSSSRSVSSLGSRRVKKKHKQQRRPKRGSISSDDADILKQNIFRMAIVWVIGFIFIELHFFTKSISILDKASLRGQTNLPRDNTIDNFVDEEENRPPRPKEPPPPKKSLLPKRVITVLGPESSGTTFLSTTLAIAIGAFTENGGYVYTPAWAFSHTVPDEKDQSKHRVYRQYHPKGRWTYEQEVGRRAMTEDGEWEIQHLSLPWGWRCEDEVDVVEALVPEECFRYESEPHLHPKTAEQLWVATNHKTRANSTVEHGTLIQSDRNENVQSEEDSGYDEKAKIMEMCRDEVKISQDNDNWTCGAKCGAGKYDGYTLYPHRFTINITSHIEWYLQRGVDVKVVISLRDRTISSRSKLKGHCHLAEVGRREDEVALSLMADALEKYGKHGSRRGSLPTDMPQEDRVIAVSYEGLMELKESYLHGLYNQLGIESSYIPSFKDGNKKYVTKANAGNLDLKQRLQQRNRNSNSRPSKPQHYIPPPPKESLLPKKLIAVVGYASSSNPGEEFDLTTTLAIASRIFPREGWWIEASHTPDGHEGNGNELIFEDRVQRSISSSTGDLTIQHVTLPLGGKCHDIVNETSFVKSLVPEECFRVESSSIAYGESIIMKKCRDEVHIAEGSTSWTCGAKCGKGDYSGYALYPDRFMLNISSHVEWYLSRGVDVTVVLTMRDQSILMQERLKDCSKLEQAKAENEVAMEIKKEAYKKYGKHGSMLKSGDKQRVIAVSYEGLLELKEAYLFDLYDQLGIDSTYLPEFIDGNAKYVANMDPTVKEMMLNKEPQMRHKKKAGSFERPRLER